MTDAVRKLTTLEWAQERLDNTRRILAGKMPADDYAGWLEDAEYWRRIVADLQNATIDCPACGEIVRLVASATLDLALWQHWNWTCPKRSTPSPEVQEPQGR